MRTNMPRWSPDGKRLAFASGSAWDSHRIYTVAAAGGKAEPVKGVGAGWDPNWSPDGKKLVFAPWDLEGRIPKEEQHVSIVDLETGAVEMVPGSEGMFSPRWSPDGKRLVALSGDHTLIYDFATRRWTGFDAKGLGWPTWSKDSKYVYGSRAQPDSLIRVEVATGKAEEIRRITEFSPTGGVSWTPDGEPVVLASHWSGEIYRIDVEE
jgi:Tol biopolymer transport system component